MVPIDPTAWMPITYLAILYKRVEVLCEAIKAKHSVSDGNVTVCSADMALYLSVLWLEALARGTVTEIPPAAQAGSQPAGSTVRTRLRWQIELQAVAWGHRLNRSAAGDSRLRCPIATSIGGRHAGEPCPLERLGSRTLAKGVCQNDASEPITGSFGRFPPVVVGDLSPSQIEGLSGSAKNRRRHHQPEGFNGSHGRFLFPFTCKTKRVQRRFVLQREATRPARLVLCIHAFWRVLRAMP
jgi:hypothetical protein